MINITIDYFAKVAIITDFYIKNAVFRNGDILKTALNMYLLRLFFLAKIAIVKSYKAGCMSSFVFCHFVNGVMQCV